MSQLSTSQSLKHPPAGDLQVTCNKAIHSNSLRLCTKRIWTHNMGRAKGYSRNCRGCSIDCLPNILLQDADLYYHSRIKAKSDLIHVFGGQGCIRTFRSIWVAVPLLLLAFWIAYNAWAATLSDDHLRGSLADVWAESSVLRLRSFQSATTVSEQALCRVPSHFRQGLRQPSRAEATAVAGTPAAAGTGQTDGSCFGFAAVAVPTLCYGYTAAASRV